MKYLFLAIGLLVFSSCNQDWLETEPKDKYSDATVWESPELAAQFVNGIYLGIPYPHQSQMNYSVTDEGAFGLVDPIADRITGSSMSPDDQGTFNESVWAIGMMDWNWNNVYKRIRACNLALEKLDGVPFPAEEDRASLKGQVHFLRAYQYFLLVGIYGGVPIIDHTYELQDDFTIARNSFEESVDFIVADLDAAAELLPLTGDKTRATKGSAMTLKSRILLYAASDLYNSGGTWATGFSRPELVSYIGGSQQDRWQKARDAAKAVIDLGVHSLYKPEPAPGEESRNYSDIFLVRSAEDIFLQYNDKVHIFYWTTDWTPTICGSPGYGGWGWNQISGNMVDSYEMRDGSAFDWNNPAHSAAPYSNRDPRLDASVLHEGSSWMSRETTNNIMRMGKWQDGTLAPDAGLCNYYLKKFIDPTFNHVFYGDRPHQPWVHMRYAEVLLNYAEACIELGQDDEAKKYINMIRHRVGMPDITESGSALMERYRNERRVELAFEQHRFFDVRRWMIGDQAYVPLTGVEVEYPIAGSFANPVFASKVAEPNRNWKDRNYFVPIPRGEMNKNELLEQNPLY